MKGIGKVEQLVQPIKPDWLKVKSNIGAKNTKVMEMLRKLQLHTVCEEANCPNCGECFGKKTATFMILGKNCTRNCTFCTVAKGVPCAVDTTEPQHIAEAVKILGLRHVVITSVTRDDLSDGGASHFAEVIRAIRKEQTGNQTVIEVLIPDLQGSLESLQTVIKAGPDVINHNIETVPRLYGEVRPMAVYERSLELIQRVKQSDAGIVTKSGIMLGLGETKDEVVDVFYDLKDYGCDLLTIGQYLRPTKAHHPVIRYVSLPEFEEFKLIAEGIGFYCVASGPLVRSSYMAGEVFDKFMLKRANHDIY